MQGSGDMPKELELSIGAKMAAIDVMKHLISRLACLDPQATSNIISMMESNAINAADALLSTVLKHALQQYEQIAQTMKDTAMTSETRPSAGNSRNQCCTTVKVISNFDPPGAAKSNSTVRSDEQDQNSPNRYLSLVQGDVLLTHFCGDRGWSWGTCVRQADDPGDLERNLQSQSLCGPRLGFSGWFPWDYVEIVGESVLMQHGNVSPLLGEK